MAVDPWIRRQWAERNFKIPLISLNTVYKEVSDIAAEAEKRGILPDAETAVKEAIDFVDPDQPAKTIKSEWLKALMLEEFAKRLEEEVPEHKTYDEMALEGLKREVEEYGGVVIPQWDWARLSKVKERYDKIRETLKKMEEKAVDMEKQKELREKAEREVQRLREELRRARLPDEVGGAIAEYLQTVKRSGKVI